MQINDFMSLREASDRWNVDYVTLNNKFRINGPYKGQLDFFIKIGVAKYYVRKGGAKGYWTIHKSIMEKWYGEEQQECELQEI